MIAATNRDLTHEAAAGRFRQDLFYRLGVFPIVLPPLRERPEDIPELAVHFATQAARRFGTRPPRLAASELRRLQDYSWPVNVRELQNVIERGLIVSRGAVLRFDDLRTEQPTSQRNRAADAPAGTEIIPELEWRRRERENLRAALAPAAGRIYGRGGAAELLGIKPTTLVSRLHALCMRRRSSRSSLREPGP